MFFDQFALIYRDKLTFSDNKLSADDRIIRVDGLTEDNGGNRVVHAGEFKALQIHGEEVRAFANFEAADVATPKYRCAAARICSAVTC